MCVAMSLQDLLPCPGLHTIHLSVPLLAEEADSASDDLIRDFEDLLSAAGELKSPQHSVCCSADCNSNCISSSATHVTVGFACPALKCSQRHFTATKGAPKFSIAAMRQSNTAHEALALLQEYCKPCNATVSQCCVHRHRHIRCPRLASLGFSCPVCGELCASVGALMLELPQVSLPRPTFDLLSMFGVALSGMHSLKRFVLDLPCIKAYSIPMLGQLLSCLPPSVSSLTLTTRFESGNGVQAPRGMCLSCAEVDMLFAAIAVASRLRELHMPQWDVLVGQHGHLCVAALQGMLGLECVYVRGLVKPGSKREWSMFPSGISFRDIDHPKDDNPCGTAVALQ